MPPSYIHNAADFGRSITIGTTTEGLFLDFKRTLDNWNAPKGVPDHVRQNAQKELCRDLAQFANMDGGTLLIGVDETKNAAGIKVATRITRVDDFDGMRAWIEQAITNYCVPSTFSTTIELVAVSGGPIVAVNVRPSLHIVYMWDRANGTIEVIGRNNHGKKNLNPDELERHIMNGARAKGIAFRDAVETLSTPGRSANGSIAIDVEIVGGVSRISMQLRGKEMQPMSGRPSLGTHDENGFTVRIPLSKKDHELRIPFELLSAVWVDANRLHVLCSAPILFDASAPDGGKLRLDPFDRLHY